MQNERETYAIERHKLASHLEQTIKENKDLSLLLRQREEVPSKVFITRIL